MIANLQRLLFQPLKMPQKYAAEMICDWVGAGKAYNKSRWTIFTFKSWYANNRDKMLFHPDTLKWLDEFVDNVELEEVSDLADDVICVSKDDGLKMTVTVFDVWKEENGEKTQ